MVSEHRTQVVTMRMAPSEHAMLQALAEADGIYQSDVLRLLIRKAHGERFGTGSKPKKK